MRPSTPKLMLIAPGSEPLCGIGAYAERLRNAFSAVCNIDSFGYEAALAADFTRYTALLLHYEQSLVPGPGFLESLSRRCPGRLFVVPHEVHRQNPWAYPYDRLHSGIPGGLTLKRWVYRMRHRPFFREKRLQSKGYHACGVIPLNPMNASVLMEAGAQNILPVVPLAFPEGEYADNLKPASRESGLFGVFGFLTEANAYDLVLEALALTPGSRLVLAGGDRHGGRSLEARLKTQIGRRGLGDRVTVTGVLSREALEEKLLACDAYICPFRFRSNSASILELLRFGRPIFASRIALTQYLQDEGVTFRLFETASDLAQLMHGHIPGTVVSHGYRWSMNRVAGAYLDTIEDKLKTRIRN